MYAMAQDKEALGWFDLPGEIRNTIYRDLLIAPSNPSDHNSSRRFLKKLGILGDSLVYCEAYNNLSILYAAKGVYNEAVGVLYGENTIHLCGPILSRDYTQHRTLGGAELRFVRRASFSWPLFGEHTLSPSGPGRIDELVIPLLEHCTYLEELEFKDVGFRNIDTPGDILQAMLVFDYFDKFLQAIPSIRTKTVKLYEPDYIDMYFTQVLCDYTARVLFIHVASQAGWVLEY
ncbi:hypothetical protein PG989_008549 [Apiospora arundinis]